MSIKGRIKKKFIKLKETNKKGLITFITAGDPNYNISLEIIKNLPALEPSHALGYVMKIAPKLNRDHIIIMNLCGRGDKDVFTVADALGVKL